MAVVRDRAGELDAWTSWSSLRAGDRCRRTSASLADRAKAAAQPDDVFRSVSEPRQTNLGRCRWRAASAGSARDPRRSRRPRSWRVRRAPRLRGCTVSRSTCPVRTEPARLVEEAVSAFGGLDILVNNVGDMKPHLGGFTSITDDDWLAALTLNLLAAVRTTRAAVPHLVRAWRREHRDDQLGQRVPARCADHGLHRRQGRPHQLFQGAVERAWTAGYPGQHHQSRTGQHAALARRRRRGRGVRRGDRGRSGGDRRGSRRRFGHPAIHHARTRSPTWSCCWPAGGPGTSPVRTSSSTVG